MESGNRRYISEENVLILLEINWWWAQGKEEVLGRMKIIKPNFAPQMRASFWQKFSFKKCHILIHHKKGRVLAYNTGSTTYSKYPVV